MTRPRPFVKKKKKKKKKVFNPVGEKQPVNASYNKIRVGSRRLCGGHGNRGTMHGTFFELSTV